MESLTATAIATLLLTKMIEKIGETLGEKIPELGSKVWNEVSKLKDVLKIKSPETAAILEAAESVPTLIESQPEVFGLPILTQKLDTLVSIEPEIAIAINSLDAEVRPKLPTLFQEKVLQQTMLKGIKVGSMKLKEANQIAVSSATNVSQDMFVDVEANGDFELGSLNQKA